MQMVTVGICQLQSRATGSVVLRIRALRCGELVVGFASSTVSASAQKWLKTGSSEDEVGVFMSVFFTAAQTSIGGARELANKSAASAAFRENGRFRDPDQVDCHRSHSGGGCVSS